MDISGEVAGIHLRTDAKKLVTTARTIHLPEPQETIHMMSMLRKEACSESIHDLAYIPTQNCLADCLTKASAKAENLITAVKTSRLLDVDIHPNFRTIMEHKAFLSTWYRTFMHTSEKTVFFLNAIKISLSRVSRERPFHAMFVRASVDSENQDATKITSALADAGICPSTEMMTLYMYILVITIFLNVLPSFFPSVVTMSTSRPADVRVTKNYYQGPILEDHDCSINLKIVVTRRAVRL